MRTKQDYLAFKQDRGDMGWQEEPGATAAQCLPVQ